MICPSDRQVISVLVPFPDHDEGAPGPSHLGTGETAELNWQEEASGLAGWVPANSQGPTKVFDTLELVQKLRLPGLF